MAFQHNQGTMALLMLLLLFQFEKAATTLPRVSRLIPKNLD